MKSRLNVRLTRIATIAIFSSGALAILGLGVLAKPILEFQASNQIAALSARALALDESGKGAQISEALAQPGISVSVADTPGVKAGSQGPTIQHEGDYFTKEIPLEKSGQTLTLSAYAPYSPQILWLFAGLGVLVLTFTSLGMRIVLKRAINRVLLPLSELNESARLIAAGNQGIRVRNIDQGSEIGQTSVTFNRMLDVMEDAVKNAREAEQKVRNFADDISHEIKTPIANIVLTAERLMSKPDVTEDDQSDLVGIVREGRRAAKLVNSMSELSVIEQESSGLLEHQSSQVDWITWTSEVCNRFGVSVETLGQIDDASIQIDTDRITQAIANLISNAQMHKSQTMRVQIFADSSRVGITVHDDGPGVPKSERNRVFERLVRLDHSRQRATGGSGLGLSIAQTIVHGHGGNIECSESELLGGAKFALTLPKAEKITE